MRGELSARGAGLDAVYYCPHDISDGCDCRKPKPGMILSAIHAFEETGRGVDLASSFMIGDSETDMCAGKAAGIKTGFIGRTHAGADLEGHSLGHITRQLAGHDIGC